MPRMIFKLASSENPTCHMPLGERAEFCIKGPNVMKGCWKSLAATAEACGIGSADEYCGQSPEAFMTFKPGTATFTLDELKAFLKDCLGRYEIVVATEICAALPKTPGKLSKKNRVDEEAAKRAPRWAAAPSGGLAGPRRLTPSARTRSGRSSCPRRPALGR